jgi:hypothetical protein
MLYEDSKGHSPLKHIPAKIAAWRWRLALPLVCVSLALSGGWLATGAAQVRKRDALLTEIELAEGSILTPKGSGRYRAAWARLPLAWRLWGAEPIGRLLLPEKAFSEADMTRIRRFFPESQVTTMAVAKDAAVESRR